MLLVIPRARDDGAGAIRDGRHPSLVELFLLQNISRMRCGEIEALST